MIRRQTPASILGLAALAALFAGGCGGVDGVELNGKVFDAMGLNSTKSEEPTIAARSPLVMPPNLERLPQPGQQPGGESLEVASINDPDKSLETSEAELQRQQAEYCKVHYEQATQRGDNTADLAKGPLGPCRGSVMNITKMIVGGQEKQ